MMKKVVLFILMSFTLISCVNEKKRHLERLNELIGTSFNYKDKRIVIKQEQDFSSLVTQITIPLTLLEQQEILRKNKKKFKYYETKADSFSLKVYLYELEYEKVSESINIVKDSNRLNYFIYNN